MTIYRLPFQNDGLWDGADNWDDPSGGGHGTFQAYAFDIGHPAGGIIRAARCGTVISVENVSGNTNVDSTVPPGSWAVRMEVVRQVLGAVLQQDGGVDMSVRRSAHDSWCGTLCVAVC